MSSKKNKALDDMKFSFGENWKNFLDCVDGERIKQSEIHIKRYLGLDDLSGKSFIDIGSGSGLSSLAARNLGAKVFSFDYDPQSVACTMELKSRFFPEDENWSIAQGSVLDRQFLNSLGTFDIVYSWGVLHHTGEMWKALEDVAALVKPGGLLYIAIYNDQGYESNRWRKIKVKYNRLPSWLQTVYTFYIFFPFGLKFAINPFKIIKPRIYYQAWVDFINSWKDYKKNRGMSRWHDYVDWIGGYPFEVATPEAIFELYKEKGFMLEKLKTCGGGLGCNEFVFKKYECKNT